MADRNPNSNHPIALDFWLSPLTGDRAFVQSADVITGGCHKWSYRSPREEEAGFTADVPVTKYASAEAKKKINERNRRDSEVIDLVRCLARILIFP